MTVEFFECPTHGVRLEKGGSNWCLPCREDYTRDVSSLSAPERVTELRRVLNHPVTVPFDLIHKHVEDLMGRGVWTHEFALPDELIREMEGLVGQPAPGALEKLERIAPGKPVIVVETEESHP